VEARASGRLGENPLHQSIPFSVMKLNTGVLGIPYGWQQHWKAINGERFSKTPNEPVDQFFEASGLQTKRIFPIVIKIASVW
jgi:hypothetical protein